MELLEQILIWVFLVAVLMGAVANKTSFCTMGAVSDWVNIGDTGRMRSWVLAIAIAILGVGILHSFNAVDMSLTAAGDTGKPPYTASQFIWLRYVVGGLLFGIGMTLGSGCGNKTLVRIGGGNMKSVIVFLAMGAGAYLMMYRDLAEWVFMPWMRPLALDFSDYGISSQAVPDLIAGVTGLGEAGLRTFSALILGGLLFAWAFKSEELRSKFDNVLGGLVVGLVIVAAWYLTAGALGQALLDEAEFLDPPPYDLGAQSFTFVKPSGQFYYLVQETFALNFVTFSLVAAAGVVLGSLLYALLSRQFRIEWFSSGDDAVRHVIGGFIMGVGGVLALGCTVGQAISGASTLALGSFITFAAIVLGAALTMKTYYYKMVYEDEAGWLSALITGMVDLRILPKRYRKLEPV